jgi:archaellum component FlaC
VSLVAAALAGLWGSGALGYMFKVNNTQEQVAAHKSDLSAIHTSVEKLNTGNTAITVKVEDIVQRLEHVDADFDKFSDRLGEVEKQLGRVEGKIDAMSSPPHFVRRH